MSGSFFSFFFHGRDMHIVSVFISTNLVKYPHGQHGEGRVDNVVESDEVLIVHRL